MFCQEAVSGLGTASIFKIKTTKIILEYFLVYKELGQNNVLFLM
jgi:hypothetical protein